MKGKHVAWGCLGCGGLLGLAAAGVLVMMTVVFGAMKSSDVYKGAMDRAAADPRVTAVTGTPIETGFWVAGAVSTSGGSGDADLTIPVSGPLGEGTVNAVGTKSGGEWSYSIVRFCPDGQPCIDLLATP